MMAEALVYDIKLFDKTSRILVVDNRAARLEAFPLEGIERHLADLSDPEQVSPLFRQTDIVCGAASYKVNLLLTELAVAGGCHYIDLGGNNAVVERQFELSDKAAAAGISVMPDCGLAPGMVSVLVADGVNRLAEVDSVKVRVGGIPRHPEPPLQYALFFSAEGLLNEYREETVVIRNGELMVLPSLTEPEPLSFPPSFPELEAFHTSGGASTLPLSFSGRVRELDYKTIRYPGHLEKIRLLFDLGLADENPVHIDGSKVSPGRLLCHLLESRLPHEVPDVVLVSVIVKGRDDQGEGTLEFFAEDHQDQDTGHSAMQRMTAYSAGIVVQMLVEGTIEQRGTLRSELGIPPARFIELLATRGITLQQL
jgi:lysine 6-dehydrogenase